MLFTQLSEHLLYSFKGEHELLKSIREVRDGFTVKREDISSYSQDQRLTSAYTAFYFPLNYSKLTAILEKLPNLRSRLEGTKVLEIGAGPGSFTFPLAAIADEVYYLEKSKIMVKQLEQLNKNFFHCSNIHSLKEGTQKDFDFLIFTNSANEISHQEIMRLIKKYSPKDVLFIEPGTIESFKNLLELRSDLLKDYEAEYPCPKSEECPLRDQEDWCHQYLKLSFDQDYQRLCQLLKVRKKWNANCIHHYSKTPKEAGLPVILRVFTRSKFSLDWEVCLDNQVKLCKNFKRDYSKGDYKKLDELMAGDQLDIRSIQEQKDGSFRIIINHSPKSLSPN